MSLTTVTLQERRFHPLYLTVKVPGVPLLPIASPSPSFVGGDEEDINKEPFPPFTDICPPIKAEAMHCVVHCHNDICRRLTRYNIDIPPCRCGDEVFQDEQFVCTPPVRGPEITVDNMFVSAFDENWSPTNEIRIRREDARKLMNKFEPLVTKCVLMDRYFMSIVRERWEDGEDAAKDIVLTLFMLIETHINRTMRNADIRSITPLTLRAESKFYLSTGLEDWINDYCEDWEREMVTENSGGDPRRTLEAADFGLAGTVSDLWVDCLNDIVLLFVLRDARVREFVAEQPLWPSIMVTVWTLVVQFVKACVYPASTKMRL